MHICVQTSLSLMRKNVLFEFPVKQYPMKSTQNIKMTRFMYCFRFNLFMIFENFIFHLLIWSYVKTMYICGSHLGLADKKNHCILKTHSSASAKNSFKHFPIASYIKFVLWWHPSWISDQYKN